MNGRHIFVDTSGFIALMDADDYYHKLAKQTWESYAEEECTLSTSDYVRLESWALIQRRLGAQAARRRNLNLVDITSFLIMRNHQIMEAFSFDGHFAEEGFVIPS